MASDERRQIQVPISLNLSGREVTVPLPVEVTFAELVEIVEAHLGAGEELSTLLLEHHARRMTPEPPSRPRAAKRPPPEKSDPAPSGDRPPPGAESPGDGFAGEELDRWRGQPSPPWSGRGKKSRARRLWEAANG